MRSPGALRAHALAAYPRLAEAYRALAALLGARSETAEATRLRVGGQRHGR